MVSSLKKIIFSRCQRLNNKPVKPDFFQDRQLSEVLHREGYCVVDLIKDREVAQLKSLFSLYYVNKDKFEGSFFGIISKKVSEEIFKILAPSLNKMLINYKIAVSVFAVKTPGRTGKVRVHQDGVITDETKHTNITIWIPLQSIDDTNSPLYIIPRSHHLFDPLRTSSIEIFDENLESLMQPYFQPLYIQVGKALLFDSRLFHFSPPNLSGRNRVNVILRICSSKASIMANHKKNGNQNAPTEIWECPDDYWMYDENHLDHTRPEKCRLVKVKKSNPQFTVGQFQKLLRDLEISPAVNKS
ncbi:MAG: phytanoyl-CoA dioxygenase family protein [Chitinophagales bacterium]